MLSFGVQTAFADTGIDKPPIDFFASQKTAYAANGLTNCIVINYINATVPSGQIFRGYQIDFVSDTPILPESYSTIEATLKLYFAYVNYYGNSLVGYNDYPSITDLYIDLGIDGYQKPEPASDMVVTSKGFKTTYSSGIDPNGYFADKTIGELLYNDVSSLSVGLLPIRKCYTYSSKYTEKKLTSNATIKYHDKTTNSYVHQFFDGETEVSYKIDQITPNSVLINYLALGAGSIVVLICIIILSLWRKRNDHTC